VFSVVLSLALGLFASNLPASSVASGVAIAVCFAPEEDCAAFAVVFQSARRLVPGRVSDIAAMANARLRRLFWRVADDLDYLVTLARLRILDALAGPLPETEADRQRARDRERIEKAFPAIEP
jgi:hypothetical protein